MKNVFSKKKEKNYKLKKYLYGNYNLMNHILNLLLSLI